MDTSSWKWFRIGNVFSVKAGKYHYKHEYKIGETPYLSATAVNNGVGERISLSPEFEGGSVTTEKVKCTAFYQPVPFCASSDVNIIRRKDGVPMNQYVGIFLSTIIDFNESFRWTYGRQCRVNDTENIRIKLPVTPDGTPDWKFMEDFVKDHIIPQLPKKAQKVWLQKYDTKPLLQEKMKLNTQEWKWFLPSDIFTEISIAPSSDLNSLELDPFGVNYLNRAVVNNGYECKVKRDESKVTRGNFISVVMVGVPSFAFYQKNDVICSQNILVLRYPAINQYNALFLCAILQKDGYRYSYGRTLSKANFLQTRIKLPVTPSGEPDWQFMEDYIKSLPFSKNIEPSKPNEVVDELVEMKKEMIKRRRALEAQQNPSNLVNYGTVNIYEK